MADSREYRGRFWITSGVFVAILVATIILLAIVWEGLSRYKLDFTRDGLYTLSEPFREILGGLEDRVIVRYYVSEEVPSVLLNLRRDTEDMLAEVKTLSGGRVEFQVLHPEQEAKKEARRKVEEYKKAKEENRALDDLEPKARESFQDLLMGRKKKTPAEIRTARKQRAAAYASKAGRDAVEVELEMLADEYEQTYLDNLTEEGIVPRRFQEQRGSSIQEVSFYSAMEIRYRNREPEVIPFYYQLDGLELELAQRILKLTMPSKPVVAFFDGRAPEDRPPPDPFNPRPQGPQSDYQGLIDQVLRKFFDVRMIALEEGDSIEDLEKRLAEEKSEGDDADAGPKKISCLVVAQPDNLEERQVYEISRAISRGIPTIMLVSRHSIDTSEGPASGWPLSFINPGAAFDDLLKSFGIELHRNVLGSNVHTSFLARVQVPVFGVTDQPYPFYCAVLATARDDLIADDHFLLNRIQGLAFPVTNGMTVDPKALEKTGATVERLAWTSPETWAVEVSPFSRGSFGRGASPSSLMQNYLDELVQDQKRPEKTGTDVTFIDRKELAVLFKGKLPFFWQGKEIPEWKKEEKTDDDPDGPTGGAGPAGPQEAGPEDAGTAGEPAPAGEESAAGPEAPAAPDGAATDQPEIVTPPAERPRAELEPSAEGQLLVLASTDAMKDVFLSLQRQVAAYQFNLRFFQNAIETFGLGRQLIEIRRKQLVDRRFVDATEGKQAMILVINLGLVPLAVVAFGLARYLIRRRDASAYERQMTES